ncbi:OB-fold protein [Achromobacter aloeverae]
MRTIFRRVNIVLTLCTLPLAAQASAGAYQPSPVEQAALKQLAQDDRQSFSRGGVSILGDFLGIVNVTAAQASEVYQENEVAGDQKFLGKKVLITGTLRSINSGLGNSPYLVFDSRAIAGPQAHFDKAQIERIAKLKKGQKVVVYCQGAGAIGGTPMFKPCLFADDAADRGWLEIRQSLDAFYAGKPANHSVIPAMASAFRAISTLARAPSGCPDSPSTCKQTIDAAVQSPDINEAKKQALQFFRDAGMDVSKVKQKENPK